MPTKTRVIVKENKRVLQGSEAKRYLRELGYMLYMNMHGTFNRLADWPEELSTNPKTIKWTLAHLPKGIQVWIIREPKHTRHHKSLYLKMARTLRNGADLQGVDMREYNFDNDNYQRQLIHWSVNDGLAPPRLNWDELLMGVQAGADQERIRIARERELAVRANPVDAEFDFPMDEV
jgi:hypothetical protein